MYWRNHSAGFGLVSKLLHGAIAMLMLFLIGFGWYMVRLDYYHGWYYLSFTLHQWAGLLVWLLGVCMLLWHGVLSKPARLVSRRKIEQYAAKITHALLMLAVLITPLMGLIVTLADGNILRIGSLVLPLAIEIDIAIRDMAVAAHYYLAYGTFALVCIHVLAALKHQFVDKDNCIRRLLW